MIGVLGLQGDFVAHGKKLEQAGRKTRVVKKPEQLDLIDGLIIPGGESTTLIKLMDLYEFWEPLRAFAARGKPILGTCAGMILLAHEVLNPPQKSLDLIDLTVERNSYGRQRESFEATGRFTANGRATDLDMIFIRAPRINRLGAGVDALAFYQDDCVLARQNHILVASFHPELTADLSVHRYFLDMVD
jgi:5'-phosphate synthase pdxT subunit